MKFERYFTKNNNDPYADIKWVTEEIKIKKTNGEISFYLENATFPDSWSQTSKNICASKYFLLDSGKTEKEHSVAQLINRVAGNILRWGLKQGYFDEENGNIFYDELRWLMINRYIIFNTPMMINAVEYPEDDSEVQSSACFILDVEDNLESIYETLFHEANVFKNGSGAGFNLSKLRAKHETLNSNGGVASGPVSFSRLYDKSASCIKSGGRSRRAAKLQVLNDNHPDIEEFVKSKSIEENKLSALIANGFSSDLESDTYKSIDFQNQNNSVLLSDDFMEKVKNDEYHELRNISDGKVFKKVKARELLKMIAEEAHKTGDPGVIFRNTINDWFTCSDTDEIVSSNPCFTGDTLIAVADGRGAVPFKQLAEEGFDVLTYTLNKKGEVITKRMTNPRKTRDNVDVYKVTFDSGLEIKSTLNHEYLTPEGVLKPLSELKVGDGVKSMVKHQKSVDKNIYIWENDDTFTGNFIEKGFAKEILTVPDFTKRVINLTNLGYGYTYYAEEDKFEIEKKCEYSGKLFTVDYENRHVSYLNKDSLLNAKNSFKIEFDYDREVSNNKIVSIEYYGKEDVYDCTVDDQHLILVGHQEEKNNSDKPCFHYVVTSNCGEFIHKNYSACNICSINLEKFYEYFDNNISIVDLDYVVRLCNTAQDILVDNSYYPVDKIAKNSSDYRPLGLSVTNLAAVIMAKGLPYDSEEARAFTSAVMSFVTSTAYNNSIDIAKELGSFSAFKDNRNSFKRVMEKHLKYTKELEGSLEEDMDLKHYDVSELLSLAKERFSIVCDTDYVRNSAVTMMVPTGTTGLILDSTGSTGIEPFLSLFYYKKTVSGEIIPMVNGYIEDALVSLGYTGNSIYEIIDYVHKNETIKDAPGFNNNDLKVFETSLGSNPIDYMGHLLMLKAIFPFISMNISKTVNLNSDVTPEDIYNIYLKSYELGLKSVTVFRDGCKNIQPLNIKKEEKEAVHIKEKKSLPRERDSITHKVTIGGHEFYITVGLYKDNTPGEVFIKSSKEGSIVSGLLEGFSKLLSISLQYGTPLSELERKFTGSKFQPDGLTDNSDLPMVDSIIDYLFKYLKTNFDHKVKESLIQVNEKPIVSEATVNDGPPCSFCGSLTFKAGTCFTCPNCGESTGCGG